VGIGWKLRHREKKKTKKRNASELGGREWEEERPSEYKKSREMNTNSPETRKAMSGVFSGGFMEVSHQKKMPKKTNLEKPCKSC